MSAEQKHAKVGTGTTYMCKNFGNVNSYATDIKKQIQLLRLNVEANSFPVGLASLFILVAVAFFVV